MRTCKRTASISLTWIGHPGDSPLDVRARPFLAKWSNHFALLPSDIARAKAAKRVVARWDYYCAGVHDYDVTPPSGASLPPRSADNEEGQTAELQAINPGVSNQDEESDEEEPEEGESERRGRWYQCGAGVKLRVRYSFVIARLQSNCC